MNDDLARQAIESERLQIGHEIHDALLPLIVGAKWFLEAYAADQPTDHRLDQVLTLLGDASEMGRSLLSQVYPPELSKTNWTLAVKSVSEKLLMQIPGGNINWQFDDASYEYPLPIAASAYRIVVEAIRNATHHGKATHIRVEATETHITVEDNGTGFEPDAVPDDRYGLRCMKGRARLVGGDLELRSKPGGPTTVCFRLPNRNA